MLRARALIVLPLAALLAGVAVRAMVFESPADHPLRALEPMFAGHPDAVVNQAMTSIGGAAAKGAPMPPLARRAMIDAACKAPLAPEPYLVEGTIAQIANEGPRAEALFLAARLRNPRAPAARYFLADRFLRTGRIVAGLDEMAVLARLSEAASQPLAPALAAYARSPGAIPRLQRFFLRAPTNRDLTLDILARDPANAGLVLALAPPLPVRQSPPPDWQGKLVGSLVAAGDYAGAEAMWSRLNGISNRGLLYDRQFRDRMASPPFNWQFAAGGAGVAEPSGGDGLNVVYYGREEIGLASQLLRLAPGGYRLAMRIDAPARAAGLAWTVTCAAGVQQKLLQLPLDQARTNMVAAIFAVPVNGCPIQLLELRGQVGDSPTTAQLTITDLQLVRAASGG